MLLLHSAYRDAIHRHYERAWGRAEALAEGGVDLPRDFSILRFNRDGASVYATCCMSQPEDEERLELHLILSADEGLTAHAVELLTVTAHFHRTGAKLGLGHTVNFGRPFAPGSPCSYGLVSLPYLDGPSLEWLETPRVRCLWLIPITAAERQFKIDQGLEALEEAFEDAGFDYANVHRPSVV